MLVTGITASDFELYATPDQRLRFGELKGKRGYRAFYPDDWSSLYNKTTYKRKTADQF